jgi:hypothetical protein
MKIWQDRVPKVKAMLAAGFTHKQIATHFNVTRERISAVVRRYITVGAPPRPKSTRRNRPPQAPRSRADWARVLPLMIEQRNAGMTGSEMSKHWGLHPATVERALYNYAVSGKLPNPPGRPASEHTQHMRYLQDVQDYPEKYEYLKDAKTPNT